MPGRLRALGLDEAEARAAVVVFLLTATETLVSFVPRLIAPAHDTGPGPDRTTDALTEVRAVVGALRGFPGLRIVRRRPARGVLIPAYARLSLRAGG